MVYKRCCIAFIFVFVTQCITVLSENQHPVEDTKEVLLYPRADISDASADTTGTGSMDKPDDAAVEILFRVETPPRPFHLDCNAGPGDSSQYDFFWKKDNASFDFDTNDRVEMQGRQLIFHVPEDGDAGVYQCSASEAIDGFWLFHEITGGAILGSLIRVKKTYMNVPQATLQHVKPVAGRPFQLQCQVPDGYPKPTVQWKRQPIGHNNPDALSFESLSTHENLTIANVTRDVVNDGLKYVCTAKSPAIDHDVTVAEYLIDGLVYPEQEVIEDYYPNPDLFAVTGNKSDVYCRLNSLGDVIRVVDHKLPYNGEDLLTCTTNGDIPEYPIHITLYIPTS